jgi:GPI-anchor transamidase subunit S
VSHRLKIKFRWFSQRKFNFRAPLPSSEIAELETVPITFKMNIGLFVTDNNRKRQMIEDLEGLFKFNDIFTASVTGINIDNSKVAGVKTPAKLEQLITKKNDVKSGDLLIVEWKNLEDEILVSSDRTIFISDKASE